MIVTLVLATLVVAAAGFTSTQDDLFNDFIFRYNKDYHPRELSFRKRVFLQNVEYIKKHNDLADNGNHSYWLGVNEYADMTNEEFRMVMNGYRADLQKRNTNVQIFKGSNEKLPSSVDWRSKGYVTPVKNQGQCGSCWSFSATGALEGQHFNATGQLVSLSERNLMDCSTPEGDHGCQGGLMDNAFRYVITNKGLDTEASYPYHPIQGKCRFRRDEVGTTCSRYVDVQSRNEEALTAAIATVGPISVAIDAAHSSFQMYHHGVYNEQSCSSTRLDHGVLAIGYGVDASGTDYYIVKNSWGATWGMSGYIFMSRNRNNQCGIATKASFPIVHS